MHIVVICLCMHIGQILVFSLSLANLQKPKNVLKSMNSSRDDP